MSGQAAATVSRKGSAAHPFRADLVELARLAGPVVAARLGIMTMGITDAVVVGRYSAVQLGYHAMAWAVLSSVLGSALGLLSGVQVMASRAIGEGKPANAGAALRRGVVYGLWIGAGTGLVAGFGGPWLLAHLGLSGGLARGATAPLRVFAISMPSFAVSVAAASWLEGLGRPTPAMVLMWIANLANLAIDLVLVPGHPGIPALGAVGAAIATCSSRSFLAIATLAYVATMRDARSLGVFARPPRSRALEIEQRRIGFGAGASNFFEMASFSSMNLIAGWISALAVAGWAVMLNTVALVFMVPLGLSTATAVMVGRAYGARDPAAMRRAAVLGYGVTAAFGLLAALVVWPNASAISHLYTTDASTVALATGALALACLFFPPDALQVVAAQSLRARGDVLVPTCTHLASYVLVMVPLAYLFAIPLHLGLIGIVWAVIIASYISAGLLLGRFWMLGRAG
ncbi:MAG: MATE family efflux transporter [Caulobacterales bacterium]